MGKVGNASEAIARAKTYALQSKCLRTRISIIPEMIGSAIPRITGNRIGVFAVNPETVCATVNVIRKNGRGYDKTKNR